MKKKIRISKSMMVIGILLVVSGGLYAECRLLMMIARNENEKITSCEAYDEAFRLLYNQAERSYMVDGWGISYWVKGQTSTGEGKVWHDRANYDNYSLSNRYASWRRVWEDSFNYYETVAHLRDNLNTKLIAAHVRQATYGQGQVPNPHPFVFETGGYAFTFAHNGSAPGHATLDEMRVVIQEKVNQYGWDYGKWAEYIEHDVDSGIYFGFLLAFIKENNWDILRGLRVALQHPLLTETGWSGKNFIFSDGFDAYAYRSVGFPGQGTNYRLEYKIVNEGTDSESAMIMSVLPPGDDVVEIDLDELVYIPHDGKLVRFKKFSSETLQLVKDFSQSNLQIAKYWKWESFPVLDLFFGDLRAPAIKTLTQNYFPSGTRIGFDSITYVTNKNNDTVKRADVWSNWSYGESPLQYLDYTSGYMMYGDSSSESQVARIAGEICPRNISISLEPNADNWVGYWLLNSQSISQALGGYQQQIKEVEYKDWKFTPFRTNTSKAPTVEFGKMYKIRLHDNINEAVEFVWKNGRAPYPERILSTNDKPNDDLAKRKRNLAKNIPNPFNPGTSFLLHLTSASDVEIHIYNIRGQKIRSLKYNNQPPGDVQYHWDGKNEQSNHAGSGVYFYRIITNSEELSGRMVILK